MLGMLLLPAGAAALTVSGTAYADGSVATDWAGCDGVTSNIGLAVNGALHGVTTCNAATGAFSFVGVAPSAANQVLTLWFDGHADDAATYTRNADTTTDIVELRLIRSTVMLASENATGLTNADLAPWDSTERPDVPVTIGAGNVLTTIGTNMRLHVNAGDTYTPGANTTAATLRVGGTFVGGAETVVLTRGGASSCNTTSTSSMRPVCIDAGGSFTAPAIVRYTTTLSSELPNGAVTFNTLQVWPASGSPTLVMADATTDLATIGSLDIGTGAAAVTATVPEGRINVTGDMLLNAMATLAPETGSIFEVRGNMTGAGTVTASGGNIYVRPVGGSVVTFGSTAGSATWTLEDLHVENNDAVAATVRLAAGGTGLIQIEDDFSLGRAGDPAYVTLDVETNDRSMDVNGFFDLDDRAIFQASSTASLTLGKDFDTDTLSTFTANTGTVTFDRPTTVSRLTYGGATTFYNVVSTSPAKVIRFDATNQTNVTNLTIDGGACGTRAGLASTIEGTRFALRVSGTASIQYADVMDSNGVLPLTATNSTSGGNNLGWTITGACTTFTVSGTAYQNQTGTVWTGCDGVTANIAMSVNGYGKRTTTCSAATGAYSFAAVPDPGLMIVVFMDIDRPAPAVGATYTVAPSPAANIPNFDVVDERVQLRSETAAPMTNTLIAMYENEADSSIDITVADSSLITATEDGAELVVEAGDAFTAEADVTVGSADIRGTYRHLSTTDDLIIGNGGTSTSCHDGPGVQMPLCVSPGGSIDTGGGQGQVRFTSSSPYYIQATTYPDLHIASTASNPAVTMGHAPGQTITVQGQIEVTSMGAGNLTTVDTALFSPTINIVGGVTPNRGDLDVGTGNTFSGTSDVLVTSDMIGGGTIDMTGGTIEQRNPISEDAGPQGAGNHTYNNIVYSNSAATGISPILRGATAGVMRVRGSMTIGRATDTSTTTLVNGAANESVDVDGSVVITSRGALTAATAAATPFTIGDDFTNQGTFTGSGGTVTFDDASRISGISTATATTFSNLASTTPNETLRIQNAMTTTVTGTLTANGGNCGSPVALESLSPGSPWTLNVGTAAVQFATLRDSTASPARTATSAGDLGGNTGWTFSGGCAAPTAMLSHDTNAAGSGIAQNLAITVDTPHLSWINNSGLGADRQRTQVVNTPVDSTVLALWHLDGDGVDAAGGGGSLATRPSPNDVAFDPSLVQAGFVQSLDTDGDDLTETLAHAPTLDRDTFTVEAWVRLDALTGAVGDTSVIVAKEVTDDDRNFRIGVLRTGATSGVAVADISTNGAGVTLPVALQGTTNLADSRWHHVAFTVDSGPADPGKVQSLFVDGVLESSGTFSGNVDNSVAKLAIGGTTALGSFLDGRIDEIRISSVARTAAELRGYVRTRMPHGTTLWDSDPTDAGINFAPTCANAARCVDVTYAGPPLLRDGARWYARGKLKSTTNIWSGWSAWDYFQTASALTINIPSGAGETLGSGSVLPGEDATATTDVEISTNDRNGYTLNVTGPDDAWGMDGPGAATLARWTAPPASPSTWAAGSSGYFGLTVLSATGGKDTATWGSGSLANDFATLRYVGLQATVPATLHRRNSYSAATDTITTSYRVNVSTAQAAGSYSAVIIYTAIPNV